MHDHQTVEGYRLSPQQRRLWLIQNALGTAFARCTIAIDGPLDVPRLSAALQQLSERHSILRTSFCSVPGVPVPLQVVADNVAISLHTSQPSQANHDLEQAPLLECVLLTSSPEHHRLQLTLPALCADTRSLRQVVSELTHLYETSAVIAEPALSYLQFSEWQNELLADHEHGASGRKHWQAQDLKQAAGVRLPNSRTDKASEEFTPARVAVTFSAEEVVQVEEFARTQAGTTAGVWLGCWQSVLWRMSGQEQLMIGYVSSGRRYEEMSEALGLFAKWVPVSAKLDEQQSISDVMRQAGKAITVSETEGDYFVWGVERGDEWTSEWESSSKEFFAAGFEYEEREVEFAAGQVVFRISEQEVETERFEVKLHCVKEGRKCVLSCVTTAMSMTQRRWAACWLVTRMWCAA
jgi:hypothetical protein